MTDEPAAPSTALKRMIWLYFWLLFLEGILRKWVFPQYSDILFVVRDPVVVGIYLCAIQAGFFPARPALVMVLIMAVAALLFAVSSEALPLVVLFGLRVNFLHLPLVFVMGAVLDRDDVLRFGRWVMGLAIPVLVLMLIQFNSESDAVVNAGASGESAQLIGALGHIRPAGPFSFTAGIVMYFGLTAAFVLNGWLSVGDRTRFLAGLATVATVVAVPVSISRSLLFTLLTGVMLALVGLVREPRRIATLVGPLVVVALLVATITDTEYGEAFAWRWTAAETSGGGDFQSNIVARLLDGYLSPFRVAVDAPLLGRGIGLGTVAGARLMTGQHTFLLAEDELTRCILELGPVLGFAFVGWRFWLAGHLLWLGWRKLTRHGDILPWLLAGGSVLGLCSAQWGPATTLGFSVFGAGLALAALNGPPHPDVENEDADDEATPMLAEEAAP